MFQNDQVFSGEIGLLVLTGVPIFVAALVGFAVVLRRDNAVDRKAESADLMSPNDTGRMGFGTEPPPSPGELTQAWRFP